MLFLPKCRKFSLHRKRAYPWLFACCAVVALVAFPLLPTKAQSPELLLSLVGSIAAFVHFLYAQHNSNTERFIQLFREFNARYDKLNDRLNVIAQRTGEPIVDVTDFQHLYDYFNLCAEEHLFAEAGYIDRDVWASWRNGMKYFAAITEIRRVWARELEQGSYYGFTLAAIDAAV